MDQHPIPQNVTQYQFRLIGNMTLKQFAMLGGCILSAFILSKAAILPTIFRYPLVAFLVLLGLALAFLPYEERSLDVWLINFIRSIYNPTQYLWKPTGELPEYLQSAGLVSKMTPHPAIAMSRAHIAPYLQSMQQQPQNSYDSYEDGQVNRITSLFLDTDQGQRLVTSAPQTTSPAPESQPKPVAAQPAVTPLQLPQKPVPLVPTPPPPPQKLAIPLAVNPIFTTPSQPQPQPPIPQNQPLIMSAPPIGAPLKIKSLKPDTQKSPPPYEGPPMFSEDQMPPTPDIPNTVVGAVMTHHGQLLPNTIIEIRDGAGLPVRAIKSNRLGQFFIATPLPQGSYTMIIEHETHSFDTISIEAKGAIIPPLKVISKSG